MGVRQSTKRGYDRLTATAVRSAKTDGKPIKLSDGRGLYLFVQAPGGANLWRLKYRHGGKERVYSIGPAEDVTLAQARAARDEAREWLRQGKDPTIERRVVKASVTSDQKDTFEVTANEWLARQVITERHRAALRILLDRDLLKVFGDLPLASVTTPIVLEALRRVEARGLLETAAKCRRLTSQIFRYAIAVGRAGSDPAESLRGALQSPAPVHRATIPASEMPKLFKTLAKVPSEINTRLALYWVIVTACRTGEMRGATWGEIEKTVWRIPAARMKMQNEHIVPLSRQAQQILTTAKALRVNGTDDELVFPGFSRSGALSENALLALLARAGYYGRQTAHGFRASFSTWAHEVREADPDVIEACLAHVKEGVRGIYNRASYLSRRLELLQGWADQCGAWGMKVS